MFKVPVPSAEEWISMTKWIEENKIGDWGFMSGHPCYFTFDREEDKVKFILRWV